MKEKRGPYQKLSDEIGAKIEKDTSKNGDSAAEQHFSPVLSKPISHITAQPQTNINIYTTEQILLCQNFPPLI